MAPLTSMFSTSFQRPSAYSGSAWLTASTLPEVRESH